jgi:hypothetical protein
MKEKIPDWTGIVLDKKSVKKLEKLFEQSKQPTMNNWFVASDHATICVGRGNTMTRVDFLGLEYKLWAYEIGWNETCIAVKVKFDKNFKTDSQYPHITLAYDLKYGKGGYNSNFITLWERLQKPIELKGSVKEWANSFVNKR